MTRKTLLLFLLALVVLPGFAFAQDTDLRPAAPGAPFPYVDFNVREAQSNQEVVLSIQLLLLLAVLTLAPSILILMTSFLRIAIVFDFVKRALSLQQVPPTQILMGLALFLSLFIMWPTMTTIVSFRPRKHARLAVGRKP